MWPGGKDGAGVAQRLINQIPPHDVFVSAFLGDCAIMRRKRPAARNIGIDLDERALARFSATIPGLELWCCDALGWLRHKFGFYRFGDTGGAAGKAALTGDFGRWFVYADPPYRLADRHAAGRRYYRHEMTDEQHAELIRTLRALPCMVMVSHYPCAEYEEGLAGWRTFTFRNQTRGGSALEQVWCNYSEPETLHDHRFLGDGKRRREVIRRRRANLRAKLLRLPPLERAALLEEVAELAAADAQKRRPVMDRQAFPRERLEPL